MNQPAKAQEPSMEEILASIRRIISDDDTAQPSAAAAPKPAPPPPPRQEAPRPAPAPVPPRPAAMPPRERVITSEPPAPPPAAAANGSPALADDILDLTEDMTAPPEPAPAPAPSFRTIDGQPDVIFTESEVAPMPPPPPPPLMDAPRRPQYGASPAPADRPLLSSEASIAVNSAFNQLAQSVFTQNGHTIEDLVREMLRPMLKNWLDDNLPGLVERLVRAEIERVSRGRN